MIVKERLEVGQTVRLLADGEIPEERGTISRIFGRSNEPRFIVTLDKEFLAGSWDDGIREVDAVQVRALTKKEQEKNRRAALA
ncbi:MAG: hypothetical protein ACYDHY_06840 [Acidiferrobacterales bacterium]